MRVIVALGLGYALGIATIYSTAREWSVGRVALVELQWMRFAECHVAGGSPRFQVSPRGAVAMQIIGCDVPVNDNHNTD